MIFKRSLAGFSLVELIVMLGMLGGVSLIVMNLTKQSNQSSVKFQYDTEINLITNEIVGILSDPAKCLATFGATASPSNIGGKFYVHGDPLAPTAGYGNGQVGIHDYSLTATGPDGVLSIAFNNKKLLKGEGSAITVTKKINLHVEGVPGAITSCRSLSSSTVDIWTRQDGTPNIYYNGGNVGVGTSNPMAKLEVSGEIKIGNTNSLCNASNEGQQRYNSTSKIMEFCNGSAWTPFGGSSLLDCQTVSCNTSGCTATCPATYTLSQGYCAAASGAGMPLRICQSVTSTSVTVVAGDSYAMVRCCK